MYLVDHSKRANKYICKKNACYINLQLPILFFAKSVILDMHQHKTYLYIIFQQNLVCRSVKTVHTNLFAKIHKLHKFATTNNNLNKKIISYMRHRKMYIILKNSILLDMHHHETYMYINFQQNRVHRSVINVRS